MKTIEITDEMYDSLMELSKEINTQDHRGTQMPYIFQIQTQEEVAVPEGCGTEAWYFDGSKLETQEEIDQAIFDYYEPEKTMEDIQAMDEWDKEDELEKMDYRKINYDFKDHYENAFFTAKACKEHIRLNHYHYHKPIDYLSFATRNPEMELIFKFLCELTNGKLYK